MKTLLALLTLTFTMTTFADCRIAFLGGKASDFSKAITHKKGFKIIDIKEVQVGDYIDTFENYYEESMRLLGLNTSQGYIWFDQIISRVTEEGPEVVYSNSHSHSVHVRELYNAGTNGNKIVMNKFRAKGLPSCRRLSRK